MCKLQVQRDGSYIQEQKDQNEGASDLLQRLHPNAIDLRLSTLEFTRKIEGENPKSPHKTFADYGTRWF